MSKLISQFKTVKEYVDSLSDDELRKLYNKYLLKIIDPPVYYILLDHIGCAIRISCDQSNLNDPNKLIIGLWYLDYLNVNDQKTINLNNYIIALCFINDEYYVGYIDEKAHSRWCVGDDIFNSWGESTLTVNRCLKYDNLLISN